MLEVEIFWNRLQYGLSGIYIALLFFGGLRYIKLSHKKEKEEGKFPLFGIGIYFLITILSRIFYDVVHISAFQAGIDYWIIGHTIGNVASIIMLFYVEKAIRYTRFMLTTISAIICLLSIIKLLDYNIGITINSLLTLIMLFLIFRSSGPEAQNIALFFIIGLIIALYGNLIYAVFIISLEMNDYRVNVDIMNLSLQILALIFFITPTYITLDKIRGIKSSIFLAVIIICIMINACIGFGILFYDIVVFPEYNFSLIYFGVAMETLSITLILMYIYKRNKRFQLQKVGTLSTEKNLDILNAFSKPETLTEEEVSVAKEKGVCLVCKNEVSRQMFMCPDCKAIYCLKCSEMLADLENACWVCGTAFDTSRPVKQEKKVEDVQIEADLNKNKKGL